LVLQVERQKQITGEINLGAEVSALAVNRQGQSLGPLQNFQKKDYKKMRMEREAKRCDHCGMRGHLKEECFKLVGYPDWFKNPKGKPNQRQAANVTREGNLYAGDNPLDFGNQQGESSGVKPDNNFIWCRK